MKSMLFGVGYRPVYSVVIKGQWANYFVQDGTTSVPGAALGLPPDVVIPADVELDYTALSLALSVMF
jgi:hypothetical protein